MSYLYRLVALVFVINVGMWAFGYASLQQSRGQYVERAVTSTKNLSELMFQDLAASYQQTDRALVLLAEQFEYETRYGKFDSARFDEVIRRRLELNALLVSLNATNARGEVTQGVQARTSPPTSVADRPYFIRLRDDPAAGLVISEPVKGRVSGQWGLVFARRLNAADGSFAGVILANLGLDAMEKKFSTLDVGKYGSIALRNENLALVLRLPKGDGAVSTGARVISSDFQQALARDANFGTYVSGATSIDGTSRVHTYRKHPALGFYVNVGFAERDFLAHWHEQLRNTVLFMLGFTLLSGLATWGLLRSWQQQQRGAAELAASFSRMRRVIDASPVPYALSDDQGKITYLNSAFTDRLGYTLADIPTLDDWWAKAYPEASYRRWANDAWTQRLEAARRSGMPFSPLEVQIHCKDGSLCTVLASAARIDDGFVHEQLVVLYDITEQRKATEAMRLSEERYSLAINASNDGIWDWDIAAGTAYHSPRWKRLLGYDDAELSNTPATFFDAIHPDDTERVKRLMQRHFDDDEPFQIELRMRCKDNEFRWFLARGQALLDAGRKPLRMVGSLALIHERKLAEGELLQHRAHLEELVTERTDALSLRERQFRLILDSVPGVISYFDAEERLLFANKAYQRFLAIDPVASAGRTLQEMYGAHIYQAIRPHLEQVLAGQACEFVQSYPTPGMHDGSTTAQVYYVPDMHAGTVRGFFVLAFDITELARARERAEAASLSKTRFLANMSHEIRTPLTAIMGMSSLVRRSGVTPQQAARLDKLDGAAKHLLEIINVVLDLAKIESGKFVIDEARVSIPAIVEDVISMVSESALARQLQLVIELPEQLPELRGDPTRIRQALLNYVGNAIKFTRDGVVTVGVTAIRHDRDMLTLRFEVRDTGPGIDDEVLARLFNAFEQADNSVTREHGGTGLGLVITQRLAQLMGGEAGATSRLGEGSVFWFTVCLRKETEVRYPLQKNPVAEDEAGATLRTEHRDIRVLIVDDDQFNSEILASLMEDIGVRFDQATNGLEAVACVEKTAYDLILMDMQMPVLDGLGAARRIRQLANGGKVAIIATTANAFPEDRKNCLAAGMDDFLAKPFDPNVLYGKMLAWLQAGGPAGRPD